LHGIFYVTLKKDSWIIKVAHEQAGGIACEWMLSPRQFYMPVFGVGEMD
jgi:hypothetical protein